MGFSPTTPGWKPPEALPALQDEARDVVGIMESVYAPRIVTKKGFVNTRDVRNAEDGMVWKQGHRGIGITGAA